MLIRLIALSVLLQLLLLVACTDGAAPSVAGCPQEVDCNKDFQTIAQIQGSGSSSPWAGQRVSTSGIVTAVFPNLSGFFMQASDPDPGLASQGLFVYLPHPKPEMPAPRVGDAVILRGLVSEYHGLTELIKVQDLRVLSSGHQVVPLKLALPLPPGQTLERYEGMLVRITTPMIVSQNYFLARYGQLTLAAGSRLEAPTIHARPSSSAASEAEAALARRRLVLDDGSSKQSPRPIPYWNPELGVRSGDQVSDLVGIIDEGLINPQAHSPSAYRLQPIQAPMFTALNPRPSLTPRVRGTTTLASMNVMNYFTTPRQNGAQCGPSATPQACRGAHNAAEFQRQRDKIHAALASLQADIVALMEIENNGDVALQDLVDGVNERLGGPIYALVHASHTGHDAVRVALIYKPQHLKLAGDAQTDAAPIHRRTPVAQTFISAAGERFSVVVVHLKSKRCEGARDQDEDTHDGQACFNHERVLQAQALLGFVQRLRQSEQTDKLMVVGDFNANPQEDPIVSLNEGGLVNALSSRMAHPYSFVYDGLALCIDQVLATPSLDHQIAELLEWHINADEPAIFDYTMAYKTRALYSPTPWRSSDHDPLLIGLDL